MPLATPLPIEAVLPKLRQALGDTPRVVLQAPPGAGKTTRVPLALLDEAWLAGRRMVMLAPRRLAARAAAQRMAYLMGEKVGATVGFQVRMERRIGPKTRIEVVTEGILTRRLQSDPGLAGVGLVMFDEFHERSLEGDLGLALCLDLQGVLNTHLRILVMSATLACGPVAELLGQAPVIDCPGRSYPVETHYLPSRRGQTSEQAVVAAIRKSILSQAGSILVFLPGAPEIRRVAAQLAKLELPPVWRLAPLYGNLTRDQQQRAIAPAPPGTHKIVLATAIAETSLTIEGVRVVVDGGWMRVPRFDVGSGMTRLVTLPVSRASADQRRGRAGRTAPGVCYRLWHRGETQGRPEFNRPEILEADLSGLVLELALWGLTDPGRLKWLDAPPAAAWDQACQLLRRLGALDAEGNLTDHGRGVVRLPLHPRLAHMVLKAQEQGQGAAACDVAALLSEPDPLRPAPGRADSDLQVRLDLLRALRRGRSSVSPDPGVRLGLAWRIEKVAQRLKRDLKLSGGSRTDSGTLAAWAYPDRIARRRPGGGGRYRMVNGKGALLDPGEPLAAREFIVALELDGDRRDARIFRAAAYDATTLFEQYGPQIRRETTVRWDARREAVIAAQKERLGLLSVRRSPIQQPDPDAVRRALIRGIRQTGITCLPWTPALRQWQARALFVGRFAAKEEGWPDFSDEGLLAHLEDWLGPFLGGITQLAALSRIALKGALGGALTWDQTRRLNTWAPTHLTVPSGSRIPIDYLGHQPVLAVRLQEMFGATQTPAIAGGRQPLLLHLLSPAGRPVQITQDMAGFWTGSYPEVKKELQGRYPKHYWPDDPLGAAPTCRAKPR